MTTIDCAKRLNDMLTNDPKSTYKPQTPYPQYTQYQLDMRRKAEILKYKNNISSTKTSDPTKKQNFSYIVNRNARGGVPASLSQQCSQTDDGASTPLPSYYSGVPGPITMLFNDPTIPLYKYSSAIPTLSSQGGSTTEQTI